jgi:alkylation response protein AidB-like acyl-CoA dehydrogenase
MRTYIHAGSIEVMTKYAQERKAFGKSIGEFGQVGFSRAAPAVGSKIFV